jgi:hypothetical protein
MSLDKNLLILFDTKRSRKREERKYKKSRKDPQRIPPFTP